MVHAAVALATSDVIGEAHLILDADAGESPRAASRVAPSTGRTLRDAVHRHVAEVLREVGGNKRQAARVLGVSRATLDRKIEELSTPASK